MLYIIMQWFDNVDNREPIVELLELEKKCLKWSVSIQISTDNLSQIIPGIRDPKTSSLMQDQISVHWAKV